MLNVRPLFKVLLFIWFITCLCSLQTRATDYEAEASSYQLATGQFLIYSLNGASGGEYVRFQSYGDGSWIEFTFPNLMPGMYTLDMRMYHHSWAGIYQTAINGVDVGAPIDYYGSGFASYGFSEIPVEADGAMTLRFTCVGLNPLASSRRVLPDLFTLTRQESALAFEFEDLPYTYDGSWVALTSSSDASDGQYLRFECGGAGKWIEFDTPWLDEGIYQLSMTAREHEYNGIYHLQLNGNDVGPSIDYFNGGYSFMDYDFGTVTLEEAGPAQIRFVCEGKSAVAAAYRIMPDAVRFAQVGILPPSGDLLVECEDASYSVNSGTTTPISLSSASGGAYLRFQPAGIGSWVEFVLPNVGAGTYTLDFETQYHEYNGIFQLEVNGTAMGAPVDYYVSGADLHTVQYRNLVQATTGELRLRFICTGQNSAAYSARLVADAIRLTTGSVSGPVIVLKLDDVTRLTSRWQRTADFLIEENIPASFGIIGYGLETDAPTFFDWVRDLYLNHQIEFWNHGYKNRSASDPLGEFEEESTSLQLASLQATQNLAYQKLGIVLEAFGPHWSGTNSYTVEALAQVPDLKAVFYYTGEEPRDWFVFQRFLDMENPIFQPNPDFVSSNYLSWANQKPYLCFQGHPDQWDDTRFENFRQVVLFLKGQGCVFMTATQYLKTTIVNP